jgi:hypothetical protein
VNLIQQGEPVEQEAEREYFTLDADGLGHPRQLLHHRPAVRRA